MQIITNFFNDHFAITISIYLLLMVLVVAIATILERTCVAFKIKAKLTDGVVGGIIIGAITSLPEMVTCITSTITSRSGAIAYGDIIGSNVFDLFVMAVCLLAMVWIFVEKKVNKINVYTLVFALIGTLFCFLACITDAYIPSLVWNGFNFFSIFVLLSYAGAVYFIAKDAKGKTSKKSLMTSEARAARKYKVYKLTKQWMIGLIIILSVILITASVFLTYSATSLIQYHWRDIFGDGFGGALLLGVVTSLPEIVCCVNLCLHKEYNMVIDTMVGSCSFNLAVLFFANIALVIVGPTGGMFPWDINSITQTVVAIVLCLLCVIYLILNRWMFKNNRSQKKTLAINATLLSLACICYIIFVILGFVFSGSKNLIALNL